MNEQEKIKKLSDALSAVLLFHSGGHWNYHKERAWHDITGATEATTKVLCDFVRRSLAECEIKVDIHNE